MFVYISAIAFQAVCLFFVAGSLIVSLYYWFWALVAVLKKKQAVVARECHDYRFALCVPAHNEAKVIQYTLQQLRKIDYPADQFDVFVVADNCTDNTADLVRQSGFECLERQDKEKRGKGFALEWGIDQILSHAGKYHAVVIVDADCYLDSLSLHVFGNYLHSGREVLQANFKIINCDENPMTFVACLGNFIENSFSYSPKSRCGAPCFLQGTGMVVSRDVLLSHPWSAFSNSEDFEYSLSLMKAGIDITFVDDAYVYTLTPSTKEQLQIQRTRWASGTITLGKTQGLSLCFDGLRCRNLSLIDAGIGIMTASRPLMLLGTLMACLLAGISLWVAPGSMSNYLVGVSLVSFVLQIAYYLFGMFRMGITRERLRLCLGAFGVGVKLVLIACAGWAVKSGDDWERTPR